ncbi:MAG: DUF6783 domain-containing protein [Lacrimispora saccharolytica]
MQIAGMNFQTRSSI